MIRIFNHPVHRHAWREVVVDSALLVLVIAVVLFLQDGPELDLVPSASTHVLSLAASMFFIGTASGIYQGNGGRTLMQTCARAALILLLALPLTFLIFGFLPAELPNRLTIQFAAMAGVATVVLRRVYVTHWGTHPQSRTRILVFGAGPAAQVVAQTLSVSDPNAEIVGFYPGPNEHEVTVEAGRLLDASVSLPDTAHDLGVDEIVVALTERRAGAMPLRQLLDCKVIGIQVYDLATHFEKRLGQIRIDFVNASWLVFGTGFNQGTIRNVVKRIFDIVFSLLLIVVFLPLIALAALVIKLDSRGPLLYRQERVGQNGRSFMVAKFRSMRTDAECDGRPRWAVENDDRITRSGRWLRRLRIDELPQLFNVLKGDMSLVGPRPERPYFVEQLTQQIPYFAIRHSVKPGVTGWAQVRYPYGATVEDSQEKLQYDLYYVKNHSLALDLMVLFETVGVVLTGRGAR